MCVRAADRAGERRAWVHRLLATCVEEVQSQQATIDAQASNMAYLNSKSNEYLDTVARLKVRALTLSCSDRGVQIRARH